MVFNSRAFLKFFAFVYWSIAYCHSNGRTGCCCWPDICSTEHAGDAPATCLHRYFGRRKSGVSGIFQVLQFLRRQCRTLFESPRCGCRAALHLSVILPVVISFYTLQSSSYTIEVYRRRIVATQFNLNVIRDEMPQHGAQIVERTPPWCTKTISTRSRPPLSRNIFGDRSYVIVPPIWHNYCSIDDANIYIAVLLLRQQWAFARSK
jgi:hypothetical protein